MQRITVFNEIWKNYFHFLIQQYTIENPGFSFPEEPEEF